MTFARLGIVAIATCIGAGHATAQVRTAKSNSPSTASAERNAVLDAVAVTHRDAVAKIISKPTLSAKYTEEPSTVHATVYEWLLDHPDRTALAWRRLNVPCVEIADAGNGKFTWIEDGSELTWQVVGKFSGGLIWYATGKVKAATLLPLIPVKVVAIVRFPMKPTEKAGIVAVTPEVSVYFHSDSLAANALLRMAGPAAPKMAEQGCEQLLFFFSGVGDHICKNPDKLAMLLGPKEAKK